jgi:hypothetical protein
VEVLLCGGHNEGQPSVLISIKCTGAFCLYIHTGTFSNDKAHQWGRERGERGKGIQCERGRGIQSKGERGEDIGREGEGRKKRVREGTSIKFTFSMFKEDIFRDRVTFSYFQGLSIFILNFCIHQRILKWISSINLFFIMWRQHGHGSHCMKIKEGNVTVTRNHLDNLMVEACLILII